MFFGAGYRVFFGEDVDNIVVLLCGGDKGSQKKDIKQAKAYWLGYLTHEELSTIADVKEYSFSDNFPCCKY